MKDVGALITESLQQVKRKDEQEMVLLYVVDQFVKSSQRSIAKLKSAGWVEEARMMEEAVSPLMGECS